MSRRITDSTINGTLYGDVDAVNQIFTTRYAVEPGLDDRVVLFQNGARMHRAHGGNANDYDFVINNFTIKVTMTSPPPNDSILDVDYDPIGGRLS